jgi:hypothetical protein
MNFKSLFNFSLANVSLPYGHIVALGTASDMNFDIDLKDYVHQCCGGVWHGRICRHPRGSKICRLW